MDLQAILHTANDIAHEAGALVRQGFGAELSIERKSSAADWVTQYDLAAEKLILERLAAAFPGHRVVGEEGGASNGDSACTWYVDPLDGTNNFAHGMPHFCVSLALYEETTPLVGVIYDPLRDECFGAARGEGAFLTQNGARRPLHVSQTTALEASLIATGFPYDKHTSSDDNLAQTAVFIKRVQGLRRAGSAALDLAYVAAGRYDGYWEFKLNSWDIAAGCLLVTEAGGCVTTIEGRPFTLTPKVALVASNGRVHDEMLDALSTV